MGESSELTKVKSALGDLVEELREEEQDSDRVREQEQVQPMIED